MAPGKGWLDWLLSEERRQGRRRNALPLVAYYWDGGAPVAHTVRDVSQSGFYLFTEHRWYLGTVVAMTLQHTGMPEGDPERAISVNARVVRSGADGVGFEFILPGEGKKSQPPMGGLPVPPTDKRVLQSFLDRMTEAGKASDERTKGAS